MRSNVGSRSVQLRDDAGSTLAAQPAPGKRTLTESAYGGGVQLKAVQADTGDVAAGAPDVSATAERGVAGASAQLPHLDAIQRSFGRHDVSHVRAGVGGDAAEAAGALGAHAYATGDRVAFTQAPDLHTAAHEAAHVVQQAGGVHLKDGLGQAGDLYEQHADSVADAVVAGKSAEAMLDGFASTSTSTSASMTSQASEGGAVQRKAVQLLADYKTGDEIKLMSLAAFDRHAHAQADWASSPTMGVDKEKLRGLLLFARKDNGLVLGACGGFNVGDLLTVGTGSGSGTEKYLTAYSRAASNGRWAGTIHIQAPAPTYEKAIDWGTAVLKLEVGLGGLVIERVIPQNATYPALESLVDAGAVDDLVAYFKAAKPVFDATTGAEIFSFIEFRREGGHAKVGGYKASLPEIKNYHRFTMNQLDMLELNKAAALTNATQVAPLPICVVLQTSLDHNGAFHRKHSMTAVISRLGYLTLVAEGKATLDELGTELTKFATYGRGGKVDEVLVAGHGNAKAMELGGEKGIGNNNAGTKIYGNAENQQLTVDRASEQDERDASTRLIATIKAALRDDPASRVVIRGCLTASNSIDGVALDPDPDTAARQIRDAIAADPSLATAIKTKMGAHQGQVRGANASYYNPTLLDGTGHIDIAAASDPMLTSTKLEYAEGGYEPTGVLRATLESWGTNRVATIDALNRRLVTKAGDHSWYETVIRAAIQIIVARPDDAQLISTLIATVDALGHIKGRADCTTGAIRNKVPDAHLNAIFTELTNADLWGMADASYLPAVVYQVWIAKNAGKVGDFLTFLNGTDFTTQNASSFFDLALIQPRIAALLPLPGVPATPPRGSFFLALMWMDQRGDAAPAEAKAYIRAVVAGGQAFPPTARVEDILQGTTERSVLEDAGLIAKAGVVLAPVLGGLGPPPVAPHNLAVTGAGNNTHTVNSVTMKCTTWGLRATDAYMLPAGNVIGSIPSGTSLNITGTVRGTQQRSLLGNTQADFYAVERHLSGNETVFVLASDVKLS